MSESKKLFCNRKLRALVAVAVFGACLFGITAKMNMRTAYAQETDASKSEDEKLKDAVVSRSSNNYTLEFEKSKPKRIRQHIYETPSIKTLAYLHWAASILDIADNENIDYFLKITECEIFKRFRADEFEWDRVRESTRDYINENKLDFAVRFEIIVPLRMGEYNKEKSYFDLTKDSQVKSVRLFEMIARDVSYTQLCNDPSRILGNYYKGFVVELSRPFSLLVVPVENETAQRIISEKNKIYQEKLKKLVDPKFNQEDLYKLREAYAFVYIKIFTYKGKYITRHEDGFDLGQLLGVVDGYEIFEDITRKKLLYSRNYITKRDVEKESENLKKEIIILKKRIADKGILYAENAVVPVPLVEGQAAQQESGAAAEEKKTEDKAAEETAPPVPAAD